MSAKSAMHERFKNKSGVKIVKVPIIMRPTQESIEELGKKVAWGIRQNPHSTKNDAEVTEPTGE